MPKTNYGYKDYQLIGVGLKYKCKNTEQFAVEYDAIKEIFPFTMDDMTEMIKNYSNIGGKKYGRILLEDFKKMIRSINENVLNDDEIEILFNLMDENETGYLMFRQYIFLNGILKFKESDEKMKKYYCEIIFKMINKTCEWNEDEAKDFLKRVNINDECDFKSETSFTDYLNNNINRFNDIIKL